MSACGERAGREVVVYTSVDQVFAEPLLDEFTRTTGIRAKGVFDIEAAKTVGLANRLVAEKGRPQADVFWNNEFMQTLLLERQGVLAASKTENGRRLDERWRHRDGVWFGSGARVRVIMTAEGTAPPVSLAAVADGQWKGASFAMALPLFGTTATHAASLAAAMGEQGALDLLGALAKRSRVVDGNSVVRNLVAEGSVKAGLTDSDDACGAWDRGSKAIIIPLAGAEGLLIPGTVAKVKDGPNPDEAEAFIDWLLKPETERRLVELGAAQITLQGGIKAGGCLAGMPVPPNAAGLEAIAEAAGRSRESVTRLFAR
jgi:iron(III) transport system substrate-binding protein